ncbi:hypothetical protein Ciccas_008976 [Cichlidogyrus casuarinus]|uniref:Uncharacterized protein n=1 Tax=Cichlidogyrus casuarinus TaxID=1844966 RepID=A0ABD2PZS4_9PLAT
MTTSESSESSGFESCKKKRVKQVARPGDKKTANNHMQMRESTDSRQSTGIKHRGQQRATH